MAYTVAEQLMRVGIAAEPAKIIEDTTAPVTSVNGEVGVVVLGGDEIDVDEIVTAGDVTIPGGTLNAALEALGDQFDGDGIAVDEIVTAGATTIPGGTLQEVLQAIADLADPV